MPLYEHVFLARQDASTQQVEELTTQMTGVVQGLGGKVTKTENWGVRSLTYRMNKNRKAHFVLLNIDAPSAAVAEIERQERISEDVIRYLSVRVEEHEEGPSAMMRKADRDRERDDRGGGGFREGGFRGDRDGGFRGDRDGGGFRGDRGPRGARALRVRTSSPRRKRSRIDGRSWCTPTVFPPPQDLSVHGSERAEDRLQGFQAADALCLRARQDRAEPHHRRFRQEAA